jgi:hypothetical protein
MNGKKAKLLRKTSKGFCPTGMLVHEPTRYNMILDSRSAVPAGEMTEAEAHVLGYALLSRDRIMELRIPVQQVASQYMVKILRRECSGERAAYLQAKKEYKNA